MKKVLTEHDIVVDIELGLGNAAATVYTCDLTYRYVAVNAEYSS